MPSLVAVDTEAEEAEAALDVEDLDLGEQVAGEANEVAIPLDFLSNGAAMLALLGGRRNDDE